MLKRAFRLEIMILLTLRITAVDDENEIDVHDEYNTYNDDEDEYNTDIDDEDDGIPEGKDTHLVSEVELARPVEVQDGVEGPGVPGGAGR